MTRLTRTASNSEDPVCVGSMRESDGEAEEEEYSTPDEASSEIRGTLLGPP